SLCLIIALFMKMQQINIPLFKRAYGLFEELGIYIYIYKFTRRKQQMVVPYSHEPFTDFTIHENKKALEDAIKKVESELGKEHPLIINGERITTDEKIVSVNPANREEVIGYVSKANEEIAERAMQAADANFDWWRKSDAKFRADVLFRAAAIVRRRKHEFTALLIKEGGK